MPSRRTVLRAATLGVTFGVAGCIGDGGDTGDGARTPTDTSTDTPDGATETPMTLPDDCPPPAFEKVPAVPEDRDEALMESFAREFERAYQRHALPANQRLADLEITAVSAAAGGYVVELNGEAEQVTPEQGTATATPQPIDARVWDATYRVKDSTVERTLYGTAAGRELESKCWTVEIEAESP